MIQCEYIKAMKVSMLNVKYGCNIQWLWNEQVFVRHLTWTTIFCFNRLNTITEHYTLESCGKKIFERRRSSQVKDRFMILFCYVFLRLFITYNCLLQILREITDIKHDHVLLHLIYQWSCWIAIQRASLKFNWNLAEARWFVSNRCNLAVKVTSS